MAEIIYQYVGQAFVIDPVADIRWLSRSEIGLFNEHLTLCGQRPISDEMWNEAYNEGTT